MSHLAKDQEEVDRSLNSCAWTVPRTLAEIYCQQSVVAGIRSAVLVTSSLDFPFSWNFFLIQPFLSRSYSDNLFGVGEARYGEARSGMARITSKRIDGESMHLAPKSGESMHLAPKSGEGDYPLKMDIYPPVHSSAPHISPISPHHISDFRHRSRMVQQFRSSSRSRSRSSSSSTVDL